MEGDREMSELRSHTLVEMPAGLAPASNDKPRSLLADTYGALIEHIYHFQVPELWFCFKGDRIRSKEPDSNGSLNSLQTGLKPYSPLLLVPLARGGRI